VPNPLQRLLADARAGLGAALIGAPQEINYGLLAIAPLGLAFAGQGIASAFYASALAALAYLILGAGRGQLAGPRPTLSLLVAGLFAALLERGVAAAVLPGAAMAAIGLAGLLLVLAGRLGLGQLFKYIPLPVLAGFTNGIAASLFLSAGKILLGLGFGLDHPWSLADLRPLGFIVGALTVAICLRPLRLPGVRHLPAVLQALVAASALHYLLTDYWGLGREPRIADWLPAQAGPAVPLLPGQWPMPAGPEWWLIGKFALAIAMAVALETLATAAHLDAETGQRSAGRAVLGRVGLTNLLLAPLLIPVAGSLGRSVALLSGGARSRWANVFYAGFLGALISLAFPLVAALPQAVIAGVLVAVARNMLGNGARQGLVEWRALRDGHERRRVAADWAVMLLVAAITVVDSFMMGLAVGTVAAMALFIRDQSRAVVRSVRFGDAVGSLRVRSGAAREVQRKYGKEIAVFEAEGILFFGSVERLVQRMDMAAKIAAEIIIDLRRVTSIDATATCLFRQIARQYKEQGCRLLLAHLPATGPLRQQLLVHGVAGEIPEQHWFEDLDMALEYAEDALLARHGFLDNAASRVDLLKTDLMTGLGAVDAAVVSGHLRPRDLAPGEALFRRGDGGDSLFLVMSGSLSIRLAQSEVGRYQRLTAFGAGAVLGEMALITGAPRSADVVADEWSALMELDNAALARLAGERPDIAMALLRNLSAVLADRLRDTTVQLSELSA